MVELCCEVTVGYNLRRVENLFDGVNQTCDAFHLWLAPFTPGQAHSITIVLLEPTTISMISVWSRAPHAGRPRGFFDPIGGLARPLSGIAIQSFRRGSLCKLCVDPRHTRPRSVGVELQREPHPRVAGRTAR